MRHTPPPGVCAALMEAAQPLMQRGSSQDLVLLLVGVAHWPLNANGGATGSGAGGRPVPVSADWLRQLCQVLLPRLPSCGAQALVLSLSALAFLGFSPGPAWLEAHEEALRRETIAGRVGGKAAARVTAAWARLRHRPTRKMLERMLKLLLAGAATAPGDVRGGLQREPLSARLFAQGLHGVALLVAALRGDSSDSGTGSAAADGAARAPADPRGGAGSPHGDGNYAMSPLLPNMHVRSLLAASASRLEYGYLDEALLHLRAWRLLRVAPHHQWLATLAVAARAKLRASPAGVLAELLCLLAWPGWRRFRGQQLVCGPTLGGGEFAARPQQQQQRAQEHEWQDGAGRSAVQHGEALVTSPATGLRVSSALVVAMAARLSVQLQELSAHQLADVVVALVALRVPLGRDVLLRLLGDVEARMHRGAVADVREQVGHWSLGAQSMSWALLDGEPAADGLLGLRVLRGVVRLAATDAEAMRRAQALMAAWRWSPEASSERGIANAQGGRVDAAAAKELDRRLHEEVSGIH
ncbi:hypothetical protein GPECTOR_6g729 [Gonium pectorale]|uniref:Uncharacterized protein n=1 Tax=Gonium pectorale TaxID=33097 RepID=A0A150GVE8_GONPE|nr:hypothetical protein GPECTOR_6g729 [Gonium pectorale]|eukprot:KXZ53811.1 hypothetical protein GPECTOR_6g729 [Gonium pectorale]